MNKIMYSVIIAAAVLIFTACNNQEEIVVNQKQKESAVIRIATMGSNSYLIKGLKGYALVDTGMDKSGKKIKKALTELDLSFDDISLIIITHAHADHMAALNEIRENSEAFVIAQKEAAEYIKIGESSPVIPRTGFGRFLHKITPPLKIEGEKVDVTFDRELDLSPYGISGKLISTPGHTKGSLTVVLDNSEIIAGDQFRGKPGELSLGMFYEDEAALLESLKKIASYRSSVIHMSHSTLTDSADLKSLIKKLSRRENN